MKEKIEKKIEEIVEHIIGKPAAEVTLDEYTILQNELKEIGLREAKVGQDKRMAELMAMAFSDAGSYGTVK